MTQIATPDAVLTFWFGDHKPGHQPAPTVRRRWFAGGAEFDDAVRARFADTVSLAVSGRLDHWQESPGEQLALILLSDQFTRNIYRGSHQAFSGDPIALATCQAMIRDNLQTLLGLDQRAFLGMPLEHSEQPEVQDQSVAYFDQLQQEYSQANGADAAQDERAQSYYRFAVAHREVISQFGRFPHRNSALGRESTPEEQEWLDNGGGF